MDRFDKFTDGARRALTFAQDEAQRFHHNYIGTEHLLLGLIRDADEVAGRVLAALKVDPAEARTAVELIVGRGDRPVGGEVGLTPRAKRVIELAIDEARRLGNRWIGTEHLLLGLVREGEGIAAGVLASLGVDLDSVRETVVGVLSLSSSTTRTPRTEVRGTYRGQPSTSLFERSVDVEASPLVRVVGIGQAVEAAGITTELIALEIREAGGILHWRARCEEARRIGDPVFHVTDDAGTSYAVLSWSWEGSDRASSGRVQLAPAPPTTATTIRVDLSGLAAGGAEADTAWSFEFGVGFTNPH